MSKTSIPNAPLPFDELAEAIKGRRSVYGLISGLRLDRAAPGEAYSSLPYRPVFVGDTETGVLHGGVVTAMLDESCGMAVQLALDGTRASRCQTRLAEAPERAEGPGNHPLTIFRHRIGQVWNWSARHNEVSDAPFRPHPLDPC